VIAVCGRREATDGSMSGTAGHKVEIVEGNGTLRGLMREILDEEGFECVDGSEAPADLLILDVDSEPDGGEARREAYEEADRPILVCGLSDSKDDHQGDGWLERPFNASDLVLGCREALDLQPDESDGTQEPPTTVEVQYDSPEMEAELGDVVEDVDLDDEEAGEGDAELTEGSDVLEIDDASSMVVDVQDLHEHVANSGDLGDEIETGTLNVEELKKEAEDLEAITGFLEEDSRTNPTVPDVPSGGEADGGTEMPEESSGVGRLDSTAKPGPGAADSTGAHRDPSAGAESIDPETIDPVPAGADGGESPPSPAATSSQMPAAGREEPAGSPVDSSPGSPRFRRNLAELASLVANSWDRIGLTARWEDRAERLERTFDALIEEGVSGASDELERVPPAHGFSGTIDVFPSFELIESIRTRDLLGRLEISSESGGFVLYFDGARLVGVDDLEGRSEAMLLDCLHEADSIDEQVHEEMRNTLEDSLAAPLEMRLRSDNVITDSQLIDARRTRAKWVVKEVLGAQSGTFAFIHGNDESGQPWPVNELGL